MLIVTSKAPGWGKQKPKQYNLAHAQASVRDNCERFGIDPIDLVGYWPMMYDSRNTVTDIIADQSPTILTNAEIKNQRLVFTGTPIVDGVPTTKLKSLTKGSVFTRFMVNSASSSDSSAIFAIADSTDVSHWGLYLRFSNQRKIQIFVRNGTWSIIRETTETFNFGQILNVVVVQNGIAPKIYVNGEYKQTSSLATESSITSWIGSVPNLDRFSFGYAADSSRDAEFIDGYIDYFAITSQVFSPDANITNQLNETPYALLQPVAPVFYSLPSLLIPQITYPSNNETGVSTTPTISWSAVAGATKYKLQVDTANTFDSSAGLPLIENEIVGGSGLLILDSHSATYKATQKPKQWGPLSAVRSAVFKNAEKLGIDPQNIKALLPLWEASGVPNSIIAGVNTYYTNPSYTVWEDNGIKNINDTMGLSLGYSYLNSVFISGTPLSFLMVHDDSNIGKDQWFGGCHSDLVLRTDGDNKYEFILNDLDSPDRVSMEYTKKSGDVLFGGIYGDDVLSSFYDGRVSHLGVSGTYSMPTHPWTVGGSSYIAALKSLCVIKLAMILNTVITDLQIAQLSEQPYHLLQPTNNRIISIGSAAPVTSQQVALAAGTTHYARVAADTP